MWRVGLAAIAALVVGPPAVAQSVEVGIAKWDRLPPVKARPDSLNQELMVSTVVDILKAKQCDLPAQSPGKFDIVVPYAVFVGPQGEVSRILVSDIHCRPIEQLVGKAVIARLNAGDFLPTGESKARWFASSINFTLE